MAWRVQKSKRSQPISVKEENFSIVIFKKIISGVLQNIQKSHDFKYIFLNTKFVYLRLKYEVTFETSCTQISEITINFILLSDKELLKLHK